MMNKGHKMMPYLKKSLYSFQGAKIIFEKLKVLFSHQDRCLASCQGVLQLLGPVFRYCRVVHSRWGLLFDRDFSYCVLDLLCVTYTMPISCPKSDSNLGLPVKST